MLVLTFTRPLSSPARNRVGRHQARAWRVALLAAGCSLALALAAGAALAGQLPVSLGATSSYAALAGSTVTSTGLTTLNGDLGVWPGTSLTGFPPSSCCRFLLIWPRTSRWITMGRAGCRDP